MRSSFAGRTKPFDKIPGHLSDTPACIHRPEQRAERPVDPASRQCVFNRDDGVRAITAYVDRNRHPIRADHQEMGLTDGLPCLQLVRRSLLLLLQVSCLRIRAVDARCAIGLEQQHVVTLRVRRIHAGCARRHPRDSQA